MTGFYEKVINVKADVARESCAVEEELTTSMELANICQTRSGIL
jgi:hypothetical protein